MILVNFEEQINRELPIKYRLLEDVDANTASWLSSTIGIASILGRPCTGFLANYFRIYPLNAYIANQVRRIRYCWWIANSEKTILNSRCRTFNIFVIGSTS